MAPRNPPTVVVDVTLDSRVMHRLTDYAREHGTTSEAVLVESVQAFLDRYPLREQKEPDGTDYGQAAVFTSQAFNLVAITDTGDHRRHKTVTNDIERVLASLVAEGRLVVGHPYQRVLYCDSDGQWDQVIIDDACQFVRFARMTGMDREPVSGRPDPRMLLAALLLQETFYGGRDGDSH